jgi:hypothetical protein
MRANSSRPWWYRAAWKAGGNFAGVVMLIFTLATSARATMR